MINKKIINATPTEINNIKFKSKLEGKIYESLLKKGIKPKYELEKFILWENKDGHFSVPYYDRVGKKFKQVTSKPLSWTYTPDFLIEYKGWTVYLEVKGFKNDVTPYKIRLFRDLLDKMQEENPEKRYCYAVVGSITETNTLLDYLVINK